MSNFYGLSSKSADAAWLHLLFDVGHGGAPVSPRGLDTKELLGYQSCVDMNRPLLTVAARNEGHFYAFAFAEAHWIISGDNRVASISPYSKIISRFSDDGRYFKGAYGPKIIDQLTYVVDVLTKDPDSRQAVLNIWRENPRDTKDVPCTISIQWIIRNGRLHCFDTMRSSDAWLGWPFDVFNFSMLSAYLLLMIRERLVRNLSDPHDLTYLKLGDLRLTAGSQHLYEKNLAQVSKVLERVGEPPQFEYAPLNVDEFSSPDELLDHLNVLAHVVKPGLAQSIRSQWGGLAAAKNFLKEFVEWARNNSSD